MFDNIGQKIKTLAKVITWIFIVISVIAGVVVMVTGNIFTGILLIIVGSLISWVGSFLLYGFGELIDNTAQMRKSMEESVLGVNNMQHDIMNIEMQMQMNHKKEAAEKKVVVASGDGKIYCSKCGRANIPSMTYCSSCGSKL